MSLIIPGQNGNISANTDVAANTAARHAAVTVTDSSEIDFTLTGQNITASLVDGSIGATRLSAGVNTSLSLANTALQPSTIGVTVQGYSAILAGITTQKITNWDTTYGWGNHASAGYLLSSTAASTYQPLDADLTAIAALAGTSGLLRKTAADTWSLDAATYLQSGAIGSTVLAYDANLQAFVTAFTLPTADGTVGQVLRTDGAGNITFVSPATGTVTSVGLSVPTGFAVSGSPVTGSGTLALAFDTGYSLPTTASQTNWNTAFGWGNHATAGYLLASTASTIYQPLDGDLTAIGGLIGTAGLLRKTAANTWTLDTTAYGTGTVTSVGLAVPTGFSVSGSPVTGSGDLTLNFAAGYALPTTAKQANWDTAFGWGNHATAGYLTTFTESDPVFGASPAAGITTQKITNWDTAFGWGNHASAGYLLSSTAATTYQPLDADLTAISALATTANGRSLLTAPTLTAAGLGLTNGASIDAIGANGSAYYLDRTNHTGTQPWGSITETPTTLAGYGITDAAFNGQIINGVAHFVQNTAPTSRINAAGQNIGALVAGDKWYKTDDSTEWFWNGTYWVSLQLFTASCIVSGAGIREASNFTVPQQTPYTDGGPKGLIFVESIAYYCRVNLQGPIDENNFATFSYMVATRNADQFIGSITTLEMASFRKARIKFIQQPFGYAPGGEDGINGFHMTVGHTGSPGYYNGQGTINYRFWYR